MKLEVLELTRPFCNEAFCVFDYVAMKDKKISNQKVIAQKMDAR
jgi:hypothetical protein